MPDVERRAAQWVRTHLGYEPRATELFAAALTHRSSSGVNYERLEFLGDAVLNLLVAELLYTRFPQASEGDLSRLRSHLVSREPLAEIAGELELGNALRLGSGELKTGGFRRKSILSDALEALCGAVYLDGGLDAARSLLQRIFAARLVSLPEPESLKDAKTQLQEYLQQRGLALPCYKIERAEGEAHAQTFWASCEVRSFAIKAKGSGSSRRRAEQAAAYDALLQIKARVELHG